MSELTLERRADGQLLVVRGTTEVAVRVQRCFPWSDPGRFVSLRDEEEREIALVRSPDELAPPSRKHLLEELVRVGFVLVVTGIEAIDEEVEIRVWRVRTSHGPRLFQTPRDEWPREVPGGGLLVSDVAGDLYHIPAPDRLDARSQKLLWAFVDD